MFTATVFRCYENNAEYRRLYSTNLGSGTGIAAKTKAGASTLHEALNGIDSKIFAKNSFINIYGLAQKAAGSRYVFDPADRSMDIVKLKNGSLSFIAKKQSDIPVKAGAISGLNQYLSSKNIRLLYVQLPGKINSRVNLLPSGVADYSNSNADEMLAMVKTGGADTLDLREEITRGGLEHDALFFQTDHHWKPETGLWAAGVLCERLESGYGFDIDLALLAKENFSQTALKNQFLGSQGKRVGRFFAGTDDFSLLIPEYQTNIDFEFQRLNGARFVRSGRFEEALIFPDNLKKDYFGINTYVAYVGGDYPLMSITNNMLSGKKILLLRDSYANTLAPFLSLAACKELRAIDPRYFDGSITGYIDEFEPDIVLMLYNPSAISNPLFFRFE